MTDLFPGFDTRRHTINGVELFARVGGNGPPLVCLHGYPQTHACWHRIAPRLAERFTLVLPDLRGYGRSEAPPGDPAHRTYAKETMARDIVSLMAALGHDRFHVMGHDRGARVAYRLALDTPSAVDRLVVLDILPTSEVWEAMRAAGARRSYHWAFLSQPAPLPETLIAGAPRYYIEATLASWVGSKSIETLDADAVADYLTLFDDPARIHAICEDYRAGATYDADRDRADRAAGRRIAAPTLLLWGRDYLGRGGTDPMAVWRNWCDRVDGADLPTGHFLVEEAPDAALGHILPFLSATD